MIKSSLSFMAMSVGKFIPRGCQRAIYKLPIFLLNKKLVSKKSRAWCKNSVALDDFIFGTSDLDISILMDDENAYQSVKGLLSYLEFLKGLFPFVGEISIYLKPDLLWLKPLINPFELRRDPELLKYLSLDGSQKELGISEKRVFAIHWLMSDHKKMNQNFSHRKPKVKRFSGLIGWHKLAECSDYQEFIDVFLKYLFKDKEEGQRFIDLWQRLSEFLNNKDHQGLLAFYQEYKEREFFMTYFPTIWLGISVELGLISEELLLIEKAAKEDKEVLEGMLSWEAWGLYTQHLFHMESVDLTIHLGHLKKVAEAIKCVELVDAFEVLESNHSKNLILGELCVS